MGKQIPLSTESREKSNMCILLTYGAAKSKRSWREHIVMLSVMVVKLLKCIVLGEFSIHVDIVSVAMTQNFLSTIITLSFSQLVSGPRHAAELTLNQIFRLDMNIGNARNTSLSGTGLLLWDEIKILVVFRHKISIMDCSWDFMDTVKFQNFLASPSTPPKGHRIDDLMNKYDYLFTATTDSLAVKHQFLPHQPPRSPLFADPS